MDARDGEIRRLGDALAGRATTPALAAGAGPRSSMHSALGGGDEDVAAVAASNARIIAQLNEQIDFLTAELAARDVAIVDAGAGVVRGGDPTAYGVDASSRVAALELEVTRLATRLEAAGAAKTRAEGAADAMRADVAALQAAVAEAQAAARIAAAEADAGAAASTAAAGAAASGTGLAPPRGGGPLTAKEYKTELERTRGELSAVHRQLAALQAEHARMAAAAEAVALDRESNAREVAALEATIGSLSTRNAALANGVAAAEAATRAARDDATAAHAGTEAARAEAAALHETVRAMSYCVTQC